MKKSAMWVFVLVLVCSWIPQGLSAEEDKVGDAATQTEICNLPPEQGMCLAYIPQYFYNSTSQSCEAFIYGGCQGNGNRFRSKAKCMETCQPAKFNVMRVEPDSLPDSLTYSLTYSLPDALPVPCGHTRRRTHSNACNQPAESGPCYGYLPQFFYNSTSGKCESFIYGGCGGNQNRFDSLTSCQMYCRAVPMFNAEVCELLPETGPCRAYKPQFFYNNETKRCEIFIYGGCAGNQNRFDSLKTCLQKCNPEGGDVITPIISPDSAFKSAEVCNLQPDVGPCLANIPRYFYNSTSEQCEQFQYGGCQGNKNNFDSERGCLLHCGQKGIDMATFSTAPAKSLDVCSLPPETGVCKAHFPRYYFNSASKSCELFVYGGCEGNPNNFVDEKGCMENCKKED